MPFTFPFAHKGTLKQFCKPLRERTVISKMFCQRSHVSFAPSSQNEFSKWLRMAAQQKRNGASCIMDVKYFRTAVGQTLPFPVHVNEVLAVVINKVESRVKGQNSIEKHARPATYVQYPFFFIITTANKHMKICQVVIYSLHGKNRCTQTQPSDAI
jgi:hypothetical protein